MANNGEVYRSLADRMSRDAVLLADELVKAGAKPKYVTLGDKWERCIGAVGFWVVGTANKYGAGADEPISQWYYPPRTFEDENPFTSARHSGLDLVSTFVYAAAVNRRRNAVATNYVVVQTNGSIGMALSEPGSGEITRASRPGGSNSHLSYFVKDFALTDIAQSDFAYSQWKQDIENARARSIPVVPELPTLTGIRPASS